MAVKMTSPYPHQKKTSRSWVEVPATWMWEASSGMTNTIRGATRSPRRIHEARPRLVRRAISLVSPRTWAMAPKRVTIPLVPGSRMVM